MTIGGTAPARASVSTSSRAADNDSAVGAAGTSMIGSLGRGGCFLPRPNQSAIPMCARCHPATGSGAACPGRC